MSLAGAASQTHDDAVSRSVGGFSAELLTLIPQLRAFRRMLTGELDRAEDLAQ